MKHVFTKLICLVALLTLSSYFAQAQISIDEDFETYPNGKPIGDIGNEFWSKASKYYTISTDRASNGQKSLRLNWQGNSNVPLCELPVKDQSFEISFKLWVKPSESLNIGIFSSFFSRLEFHKSGELLFNHNEKQELIEFASGQWQKVNIEYNRGLKLIKTYVDDKLVGTAKLKGTLQGIIDINLYDNTGAYIDEFVVRSLPEQTFANNITLFNTKVPRLAVKGQQFKPGLSVINSGSTDIEGFELVYKYNNETKSIVINKPLKNLEEFHFKDSIFTQLIDAALGYKSFRMEVRLLNGVVDDDLSDNSEYFEINTFDPGTKKVLLEYATGAWCGSCPAAVVSDRMFKIVFGNAVESIYMHLNDVMELKNYEFSEVTGVPSLYVNRYPFEQTIFNLFPLIKLLREENLLDIIPKMTFNVSNNEWDVISKTTFNKDFAGPIYHNIFIIEDSVNVDNYLYDQANFYSNQGSPYPQVMGGFELLPPLIPAKDMFYRNVPRLMVNNLYGKKVNVDIKSGNSIQLGEKISPPFNMNTLTDKHYLYHIVYDIDRKVLNFDRVRIIDVLETNSSSDDAAQFTQIHPNPCIDKITIEVDKPCTLSMVNVSGQEVYRGHLDQGMSQIDMSLHKSGIYVCTMTYADGNSKVSRIIKL